MELYSKKLSKNGNGRQWHRKKEEMVEKEAELKGAVCRKMTWKWSETSVDIVYRTTPGRPAPHAEFQMIFWIMSVACCWENTVAILHVDQVRILFCESYWNLNRSPFKTIHSFLLSIAPSIWLCERHVIKYKICDA